MLLCVKVVRDLGFWDGGEMIVVGVYGLVHVLVDGSIDEEFIKAMCGGKVKGG